MAARKHTQYAAAALVALAATAGAYGFAASLASSASGLAAGSQVIASCGSGMTVAYTTAFDAPGSGYAVSGIEVSNIPAGCRSKTFSATFYDDSGIALGSAVVATLTTAGPTQSIAIAQSSNKIDASRVGGVAVVVS